MATRLKAAESQSIDPKEGWIVFRATPWVVLGPYARFEDAVWRAASAGSSFRLAYGVRDPGVCDFVPTIEPRLADDCTVRPRRR